MRFHCGPTLLEVINARAKRVSVWHDWFAWRPIRTGNRQCVWLETVKRIRVDGGYNGWWDYRELSK